MPNTVVKMPQLGESVVEGTIGRWLKNPGDHVELDEPLVEIQTDKVNAEVASPVAGILQRILLPEGTTAAVTTDLAIIGDEAPSAEASAPPAPVSPEPVSSEPAPAAPAFSYDTASVGGGVVGTRDEEQDGGPDAGVKRFYTPVVLRIAEEHGVDLNTVKGSGGHGRVTRKDVERAVAESHAGGAPMDSAPAAAEPYSRAPTRTPPLPPAPVREVAPPLAPTAQPAPSAASAGDEDRPVTPMRRAIAEHMVRARATIPDAWSLVEIDMTPLVRHRAAQQVAWQAREGYELTYLPFFIKAVVAGLRLVPELNATWAGDHITLHGRYDLGIAVSLAHGLVVPVLRGADQLSVAGLARALRTIVLKARGGKLGPDDLQGGTFTVNNPGSLGSILSQPIVPVGQTGIVTMEAIVKRPVVLAEDAIGVRSMMNACLSFDHRVLDGGGALTFLREIKRQLETVEYPIY